VAEAKVISKLQKPVIERCTQVQRPRKPGVWGARPKGRGGEPKSIRAKPQPVFAYFLLAQKVGRTGVRDPHFVSSQKSLPSEGETLLMPPRAK